jgi:hypothetical protein
MEPLPWLFSVSEVVAGWLMADLVREQNNCHEKKLGEE